MTYIPQPNKARRILRAEGQFSMKFYIQITTICDGKSSKVSIRYT